MAQHCDPLHIIKSGTVHEGDTREEYMEKLRKWCDEAIEHSRQAQLFWQSYYMQYQQASLQIPTPSPVSELPNLADLSNRGGYVLYRIPPIWKRLMAEIIDFLILFIINLFLTFLLIENLRLLDFNNYSFSAIEEYLQNPDVATKLTSKIFILEVIHRIVVCFYEASWIAQVGATPGKKVMGLNVIQASIIVEPNPELEQVLAYPGTMLTFKDALLRSILKNVLVGLLFPICFVLLFFKHNRTGYDFLSDSLVVEDDTNRPLID